MKACTNHLRVEPMPTALGVTQARIGARIGTRIGTGDPGATSGLDERHPAALSCRPPAPVMR